MVQWVRIKDVAITMLIIISLGSINLICVPLGCLFSGVLTQPLGKRRAMQVHIQDKHT